MSDYFFVNFYTQNEVAGKSENKDKLKCVVFVRSDALFSRKKCRPPRLGRGGGRIGVEEPLHAEPPHAPAASLPDLPPLNVAPGFNGNWMAQEQER
jgi:hypothetical protein